MSVQNVYDFVSNYNNTSIEHLFLWISQFEINDQLAFTQLVTDKKIQKFRRHVRNATTPNPLVHSNEYCICKTLYSKMDERFKSEIPLRVVGKCVKVVPKFIDNDRITPVTVSFSYHQQHACHPTCDQDLLLTSTRKINIKPSSSNRPLTGEVQRRCVENTVQESVEKSSLSIQTILLKRDSIDDMVHSMNICELYALYTLHLMISRRDLERLLPEYWRSITRNTSEMKLLCGQNLLQSIYDFHLRREILQTDCSTKFTFKLTEVISVTEVPSTAFLTDEYLIQPNFNGFRVVVCKTPDEQITVSNAHGFKCKRLHVNASLFAGVASFAGEFLLLAFKDGRYWHSKYIARPAFETRFVMVDLFLWCTLNVLTFSYSERVIIMSHFMRKVNHPAIILTPFITDSSNYQHYLSMYKRELSTVEPHFNGFVYRSRDLNYEKFILKTHFIVTRFDVFRPTGSYQMLLTPEDRPVRVTSKNTYATLRLSGDRFAGYFVAYMPVTTEATLNPTCRRERLGLAALCGDESTQAKFIQLQIVELDLYLKNVFENLEQGGCGTLIIESVQRKWCVVKINFDKITKRNTRDYFIDKISSITLRPDRSLLDCVTINELREWGHLSDA